MTRILYLLIFLPRITFGEQTKGWNDDPKPSLEALEINFPPPANRVNHAKTFYELSEGVSLPKDFQSLRETALYDPQNVDPEELIEIIQINQTGLNDLAELLRKQPYLLLADEKAPSKLTILIYLTQARVIANLTSDNPKTAIRHLETVQQLAATFTAAASDYTSLRLAATAQQEFYQLCYILLRDKAIKAEETKTIANLLNKPIPTIQVFQKLIKQNTARGITKVYQIHSGEFNDTLPADQQLTAKSKLRSKIHLQPNRTAKLYLDYTIQRLSQLHLPKIQRTELAPNQVAMLSMNSFGQLLFQDFVDNRKFFEQDLDSMITHQRMTQIYCALRRYQIANRSLPEKLENLVPKYLEKVPLEYYSGKLFGYSSQEKLLWSIGPDLEATDKPIPPNHLGYLSVAQEQEPTLSLKFP